MPLGDFHLPVSLLRVRASRKDAWVSAESHRAAKIIDAPQFAQLVDHPVRRGRIELRAVCICQSANVSGEFNHAALHSQTNAEERNLFGARKTDGANHAFDAAFSKAARHKNAIVRPQLLPPSLALHALCFNPTNDGLQVLDQACMHQRFLQTLIGFLKLHILSNDRDLYFVRRVLDALDELLPLAHVRFAQRQVQLFEDDLIESFGSQHNRDFVN